jgi:T4 superinfection immunity protein
MKLFSAAVLFTLGSVLTLGQSTSTVAAPADDPATPQPTQQVTDQDPAQATAPAADPQPTPDEASPASPAAPPPAESSVDHSATVYQVNPPSQPTYAEPGPVTTVQEDSRAADDARIRALVMLFFFIVGGIIAVLAYFAPTFVAYRRHHKDKLAIFVFNLFFGWFAWIWALTGNVEKDITVNVNFNGSPNRRAHLVIDDDDRLPLPPRRGGFITGGDE